MIIIPIQYRLINYYSLSILSTASISIQPCGVLFRAHTAYHHRGFTKSSIGTTHPVGENSLASLCCVLVKVLRNCHHQQVEVYFPLSTLFTIILYVIGYMNVLYRTALCRLQPTTQYKIIPEFSLSDLIFFIC